MFFLDEKSMVVLEKKLKGYIKSGGEVYSYMYPFTKYKRKEGKDE